MEGVGVDTGRAGQLGPSAPRQPRRLVVDVDSDESTRATIARVLAARSEVPADAVRTSGEIV